MSRYVKTTTKNHIEYEVAWGYDRPLQEYFLQVFRPDKRDDLEFDPTGDGLMLSEGSSTTKRSNGYMLNLFEVWGVPANHVESLINDLQF